MVVLAMGGTILRAEGLNEQCAAAVKQIERWKAEGGGKAVKLMLGAIPEDRVGSGLVMERWLYVDARPSHQRAEPVPRADLNSLEDLAVLAEALEGKVALVAFDQSVVKFLTWNEAHLHLISRMLTPAGSFLVPTLDGNPGVIEALPGRILPAYLKDSRFPLQDEQPFFNCKRTILAPAPHE